MTDLPKWIEDGFDKQARLQASLERALAVHLPPARPGQASNEDEAFSLIVTGASPTGGYRVMRRATEMERLAQFQEALEAAACAWASLSSDTRAVLIAATAELDGTKVKGFWSPDRLPPIGIVAALPDMMRAAQKQAMSKIDRSAEAGNVGWRAVSLVGECRAIWERRTGKAAPKTTKGTGRFHDYLQAVLDELGAGQPVPAMRAWNKLHKEGQITG